MNGVANVHFCSCSHSFDIRCVAWWARWFWRNPKIIRKFLSSSETTSFLIFLFENLKQDLSDFKTCSRIIIPPLSLQRGTPILFCQISLTFKILSAYWSCHHIHPYPCLVFFLRWVASINIFTLVKIFSADLTVSDSSGSIIASSFFYLWSHWRVTR